MVYVGFEFILLSVVLYQQLQVAYRASDADEQLIPGQIRSAKILVVSSIGIWDLR